MSQKMGPAGKLPIQCFDIPPTDFVGGGEGDWNRRGNDEKDHGVVAELIV
jgi:hypothetical protein